MIEDLKKAINDMKVNGLTLATIIKIVRELYKNK